MNSEDSGIRILIYGRMSLFAKEGVEKPLNPEPSQRVMNHSDKFEWGIMVSWDRPSWR